MRRLSITVRATDAYQTREEMEHAFTLVLPREITAEEAEHYIRVVFRATEAMARQFFAPRMPASNEPYPHDELLERVGGFPL